MNYKDYIILFLITWMATAIVSAFIFKVISDCPKMPIFTKWRDFFYMGILTGFIPTLLIVVSFGELSERLNRVANTIKMLN
uniref:hypothetical protein n=1 Tax=Clostridium sp. NkU-1 TaxID=1095009 RepID=UPI0006D28702